MVEHVPSMGKTPGSIPNIKKLSVVSILFWFLKKNIQHNYWILWGLVCLLTRVTWEEGNWGNVSGWLALWIFFFFFLVNDWCEISQPPMDGATPRQMVLGYIRKRVIRSHTKWCYLYIEECLDLSPQILITESCLTEIVCTLSDMYHSTLYHYWV